jgi:hypothetical protein
MHEVGGNNVSLRTAGGTYVSVHLDGSVSAYATSKGPDETFAKIPRVPRARVPVKASSGVATDPDIWDIASSDSGDMHNFILQSSFGTYLRIATDGTLFAEDYATNGDLNIFTGRQDGVLMNQGRVLAAVNTRLILLTTSFVPSSTYHNPHVHEMYMVLWMNAMSEVFYQVHVITESDCGELLGQLERCADEIASTAVANESLIGWEMMKEKFVCVPSRTGRQPNYGDFFEYANKSLAGNMVLLANGDIVFDETLRRIAPERIMTGEIAFVLGVRKPAQHGSYKAIFGTECGAPAVADQCSVGPWQGTKAASAGQSWDAYIFAAPLPSGFPYSNEDVHMNIYGAEHVAAYAFEKSGIKLYNPCEHIHAFHWHCQGHKMHNWINNVWTDTVDHSPHRSVSGIFPCWYCPAITMPSGSAKREELCRSGKEEWLPGLAHTFNLNAVTVKVCCARPGACNYMQLQWLPACKDPDDVNCVIWENIARMRWY